MFSEKNIMIVLLVFIFGDVFFSQGAFYACPTPSCDMELGTVSSPDVYFISVFGNEWTILSVFVLLLSLFGVVILVIFAKAVESKELELFAKGEILQAIASVLIIFSVIYLVDVATSAISTGSGVTRRSLACNAASSISYALCKLNSYYAEIQKQVMKLEADLSRCWSIFGFQICPGLLGGSYYDKNSEVSRMHMIGEIIVNLQIALSVQRELLLLIHHNMLRWFLPLGIVLRILPFSRGLGGLLIASAIGFFFIYPIVYLIALDIPYGEVLETSVIPAQTCFETFRGTVLLIDQDFAGTSQYLIDSSTEFISRIRIIEWVLPFVALSMTVIFIRYVAPILGSDSGELMSVVSRLV